MDLGQDDKDDDLKIELHTDVGQVASAVVKVADVWGVSTASQRCQPVSQAHQASINPGSSITWPARMQ